MTEKELDQYTDTLYSHLSGGIVVSEHERKSATWREARYGLRCVLREMTCAHEWRVIGRRRFCDTCKATREA